MFDGPDPKLEMAQKLAEFADRGSLSEGQFLKSLLGKDDGNKGNDDIPV